jgi:uncharacterized protein
MEQERAMQRYLITGATGFIGQALCQRLAGSGAQITALTRNPSAAARVLPPGTRCIASVTELHIDEYINAVINLAGEPIAAARWSSARKALLERSRIDLTRDLVAWMGRAATPPRVLVSASAVGFYGDQGDAVVTEGSAPHDEYSHRLCAAWEAAALEAQIIGVRTAILRIGLVIGPDGGFLQRLLPLFKAGLGGPIGNGKQWMSWIHREDLLRLIEAIVAREDLAGVFNATAPAPVNSREFARTLGRVLHRPALLPAPAFAFRLAFGEMSRLLLTGQRVMPQRALDAGFEFRFARLEDALRTSE